MNPGTREERWPVVTICSDAPQPQIPLRAGPLFLDDGKPSITPTMERQTYHPESAPNVLTPEEARHCAKRLDHEAGCGIESFAACTCGTDAIAGRLRAWAEEEGH